MPSVIARDSVAADHLVYSWPFPIGPEELEVSCADDELVVMCPAWTVGNTLGPGRHRWRSPDPMRPVAAFFVLTAPVEVSFDMMTTFMLPTTGMPVRLRSVGSLQVRCADPALLVAQFVGLPFDAVNDGILRSVSRSVERMLARLLTRRVVMASTPIVVTDSSMHHNILEELVAYNPAAGGVFGVELVRMGHLTITADDGSQQYAMPVMPVVPVPSARNEIPLLETVRSPGRAVSQPSPQAMQAQLDHGSSAQGTPPPPAAPAERAHSTTSPPATPPLPPARAPITPATHVATSGELVVKNMKETVRGPGVTAPKSTPPPTPPAASANPTPPPRPQMSRVETTPVPPARKTPFPIEVQSAEESTQPGVDIVRGNAPSATVSGTIGERPSGPTSSANASVSPGGIRIPPPPSITPQGTPAPALSPAADEPRGAILGIGTGAIGATATGSVSGEIRQKIAPGARVLVPGPNGLMQSATVRQLLQGYYELEVGSSGETIWVPMNGVVPE